jgi:hypothetical protein
VIGTRTFYCNSCKECVTFDKKELPECKCGYIFGVTGKLSDYINMRKTWSGQTKVEFNTVTMDEDIKQRNQR